jgi:aminoglycoside phosphotransferase (APT) family kinase protein
MPFWSFFVIKTVFLFSSNQQIEFYYRQYLYYSNNEDVYRPGLDFCFRWLKENCPMDLDASEASLVHGDYRNGNLLCTPDEGIVAVLDWELARIGDPMQVWLGFFS